VKTTRQTVKNSRKPLMAAYKQKLLKVESLCKKAGGCLFDRMVLLVEVFNDQAFRLDNGNLDDWKLGELLDRYVADAQMEFMQLKALLDYQPNRVVWETGLACNMYAEMMVLKGAKPGDDEPKRTRHVITQAEFKALQEENKRLVAQNKQLQRYKAEAEQLPQLKASIKELEAENRDLRKQLTAAGSELVCA